MNVKKSKPWLGFVHSIGRNRRGSFTFTSLSDVCQIPVDSKIRLKEKKIHSNEVISNCFYWLFKEVLQFHDTIIQS